MKTHFCYKHCFCGGFVWKYVKKHTTKLLKLIEFFWRICFFFSVIQKIISGLFCTHGLEVKLSFLFNIRYTKWHAAAPWLNGWLIHQVLQSVFCSWSKFSGDMNCPSSPAPQNNNCSPSVVLVLITPVMSSFTNMPCDLIMIQTHISSLSVALSFIMQSVQCHTKNLSLLVIHWLTEVINYLIVAKV